MFASMVKSFGFEYSKTCIKRPLSQNDQKSFSLKSESVDKLIKKNTRFTSFDIKFTRLGFENAC